MCGLERGRGAPVSRPRVMRRMCGRPRPAGASCRGSGAVGRVQPSLPPREQLPHPTPPPVTVAFCFLGDTRIRRCVRLTNLLRAGQLSQGGLTRRAGKADTLGQCWQASALGQWAAGPLGSSSWVQSRPCVRQPWVQVPVLPLTSRGILEHVTAPLQACFLISVMEPSILPQEVVVVRIK